jgi:hypothetical protein
LTHNDFGGKLEKTGCFWETVGLPVLAGAKRGEIRRLNMQKNKWYLVGVAVVALTGCATTVPVSYSVPARLDMSGVKRVAIDSNDAQVTSFISEKLSASGIFTVAPAGELAAWNQWQAEQQAAIAANEAEKEAAKVREKAQADYEAKIIEISPTTLVGAYQANAARADSSYKGQFLRMTGTVQEIQQGSAGYYFIRLSVGNDSVDVYFSSTEVTKLTSLNKGQRTMIEGICNGYDLPTNADTAEILRLLGAGRHINVIDAIFTVATTAATTVADVQLKDYTGMVPDAVLTVTKRLLVDDDSHTEKRSETVRDTEGKVVRDSKGDFVTREVTETIYDRSVTVNIDYQVTRIPEGSLIGQGTKTAMSPTSSYRDQANLPAASALEAKIINGPLNEFANEIVPEQRSMSLTLAKEDSKDKEVKKQMSEAQKLVKAKDYQAAAAAYGKIYAQYNNFAAGYNQALLTEATEGAKAAIGLMEALSQKTNNPTAQQMLREMHERAASNQKAAEQAAAN